MPSSRTREVESLLDSLSAGQEPPASRLAAFSDLDKEEVAALSGQWSRLSVDARRTVLERLASLSEDNVDLDFSALARVALGDPDARVRELGVETLWEATDRHVAAEIVELLASDPEESVRAAAASALRAFVLLIEFEEFDEDSGRRVVEALRHAASDSEPSVDVRARAIESLGPRQLPWVETLITDAYYSDDRRMRLAAVTAMGSSANARWLEYLFDQLQSDDPEFRFQAAMACGEIASEDAVPELAELLGDEDSEVVMAAVHALGEIGGPEALEHLNRIRDSGDEALAEAVDEALEAATFTMSLYGEMEDA